MTPLEILRDRLEITAVADPLFGENCYLVRRRDTHSVVIIDPGLQVDDIVRQVERDRLSVIHILLSHGHIDHVAGVPALQLRTGAPVAMHPDDRAILDWDRFAQLPFLPAGFHPFELQTELQDASTVAFEDLELRVLHTPGHSEGSVCFLFGLDCFAGDTLFQRSIGRTDLPGGDSRKIVVSIRSVLYSLPSRTIVHPGHGPATTIEEERILNPFVPAT
ncbi:MAG TPA: MBL fold metallo-hydrolase [Candidatus Dormibacteraeota bacterium]|nr:MBL fold metallo-hydrolase [Candidatus Dormibacteraeota bacterium]